MYIVRITLAANGERTTRYLAADGSYLGEDEREHAARYKSRKEAEQAAAKRNVSKPLTKIERVE